MNYILRLMTTCKELWVLRIVWKENIVQKYYDCNDDDNENENMDDNENNQNYD